MPLAVTVGSCRDLRRESAGQGSVTGGVRFTHGSRGSGPGEGERRDNDNVAVPEYIYDIRVNGREHGSHALSAVTYNTF